MVTESQIHDAYTHAHGLQRQWLLENGWRRNGTLWEKQFPEGLVVVLGMYAAYRYEGKHQKQNPRIVQDAPPDLPFHIS